MNAKTPRLRGHKLNAALGPLCRAGAAVLCAAALAAGPATAEPWAAVGDRGLRSDIELLAAHGLIDNLTTTWPIPAGQLRRLQDSALLEKQPVYLRQAARRVLRKLHDPDATRGPDLGGELRFTSQPALVRDFGTEARDKLDLRAGPQWEGEHLAIAVRAGLQSHFDGSQARPSLDGSYFSALLGNWQLYGGYVEQWYGPGWTSSLILSNNARPFPKIGIMRNDPHAYESPWLHWLGPVQINFFVGLLDGPRTDHNTYFGSLRITLEPVRNLELALERSTEFCGSNHPCQPLNAAFHFSNSNDSANKTNDEATLELKYNGSLGALALSPYVQIMNEDTGPFAHAYASYLGGLSLAGPLGHDGASWRMVTEYADTVPTLNWFGFDKHAFGAAYNNYGYVDGWRYRGRTLGFSLDSDSKLFSLSNQFIDTHGRSWRVVYYRARISTAQLAGLQPVTPPSIAYSSVSYNSVSATPIDVNAVEAGLSIPFRRISFDLAVRGQDKRVLPEQSSRYSGELGINFKF
jgi:hypothetical protein